MNILVTGGCGFIGTRLCEVLLDLGHVVVNIDKLTYAANEKRAVELNTNEHYKLIVGDVKEWQLVFNALVEYQIDAVMHLAAESHVDRSISGPQTFLEANVLGTYGVLEGIRGYLPFAPRNFKLLHVSTDEVFGDLPLDSNQMFDEESRYRPSSPYSASKASGDWLVRAWGRTFGIPWVMTHGANAYGPRQLPDKLIPMAIVNGIRNKPITLHGSGKNIRSWLHVDDHVSGMLVALMSGSSGESYCMEAGVEKSNIAVIIDVCDLLLARGIASHVQQIADRPGNDLLYSMNSAKLQKLCWTPAVSFYEGLAATVDWYINEEAKNG